MQEIQKALESEDYMSKEEYDDIIKEYYKSMGLPEKYIDWSTFDELFDSWDKNGNGKVTIDELSSWLLSNLFTNLT